MNATQKAKRPPSYFQSFRREVTSQHGEDGIIEELFRLIGEESRWSVELGALNGKHDSNVWHLVKEEGWSGVLIEADPTYFERAVAEYADTPRAHLVNAFVSFEGDAALDAILAQTPIPGRFDLLSLDIDGNDYHVWESLTRYRPRVVCIEYNPTIPDEVAFIQPRDMSVFQGSSARALVALGKRKGYELVAATETNLFFVLAELYPKIALASNALEEVRVNRALETKLYQLYDGTLKLAGNTMLVWHKLPLREEDIQVLPKSKRAYPARVSESALVRKAKRFARTLPLYPAVQRLRKARKP